MPLSLFQFMLTNNPALTASAAQGVAVGFIKLLFVLAGAFCVVFASILIRQVYIMKNTLITPSSQVLIAVGYAHFVLSILVLLLFLML